MTCVELILFLIKASALFPDYSNDEFVSGCLVHHMGHLQSFLLKTVSFILKNK